MDQVILLSADQSKSMPVILMKELQTTKNSSEKLPQAFKTFRHKFIKVKLFFLWLKE